MYPSKDARELAILLRISRELDIVGDISATVDNPSEVLAWATILTNPEIVAWRARDSGHRYLQVTANHERAPVRGRVTAVLPGCRSTTGSTSAAGWRCATVRSFTTWKQWMATPWTPSSPPPAS